MKRRPAPSGRLAKRRLHSIRCEDAFVEYSAELLVLVLSEAVLAIE